MHRQPKGLRRGGAASQRASAVGWILWFVVPAFISCAALLSILSFVLTLDSENNSPVSLEAPEHFRSSQRTSNDKKKRVKNNKPSVKGASHKPLENLVTVLNLNNNKTTTTDTPIVIAYAISLIKCGDFQSSTAGLQDAALVLKHSIHQTSIRNSKSRYDYKAYAIVHTQALHCAHELQEAGYELLVRDSPVNAAEIRGDYLRSKIHKEWCCGSDEFVKLYAYHLTDHPVVVHVDIDFVFHKPMDDLFDAMLENGHLGAVAKLRIPRERPHDPWPAQINAYMTRDWGQVMPGRKALFQAGFLVVRPDLTVFDQIVEVIREGHFVEGFSRSNGWGGLGYGGLVGAMAAQGLMAYVYDTLFNNTWVELNQCRYNHMGMDVLYRNQPSFRAKHAKVGQCRNDLEYCEDCQTTNVDQIYNIHYTQCRKPWNCIGEGDSTVFEKSSIPEDSVHLDHCMELLTIWHNVRTSLETQLYALTGDETIRNGQAGLYTHHVFQGHCKANGQSEYLPISATPESRKRINELYTLL